MLKILFAGTPDVAVPSLRALAADSEHFEVVAVLTRPDAPTGRGRKLTPSPVKTAALELGLPVLESDPAEPTFLDELKVTGAQAAAVIAYGRILKQSVLDALPCGWYNLHFSLLPHWRGAAPVQRAIWSGDDMTGTSVFRITRAMDAGPLLVQSETPIGEHETAGDLLTRLGGSGALVLRDALRTVEDGTADPVEQAEGDYPVAEKIRVNDAHIDFSAPVEAVDRQIRACTPNPGAWTELFAEGPIADNDESTAKSLALHILAAQPADQSNPNTPADLKPGELKVGKKNVWVGTGSKPLELTQVKAQGKKAMRAADWARGARLSEAARCR